MLLHNHAAISLRQATVLASYVLPASCRFVYFSTRRCQICRFSFVMPTAADAASAAGFRWPLRLFRAIARLGA
jgi:hypothetical protein